MPSSAQTPDSTPVSPRVNTTALLVKSIVLLVLAIAGGILFKLTPLKEWMDPAGKMAASFRGLGFEGVVLYIFCSAALILAGVPRLLLCPLAGALYGFWGGLAISTVGSMLSYYGAFLWIRGRRHSGVEAAKLPKQLAFLSGDPGFTGVVLGRLLPAPGMLITLGLSLSSVSHLSYLAGSAIGSIPQAAPAVLLGVMGEDFRKWGRLAGVVLICILGAWIVIHRTVKRSPASGIGAPAKLGANGQE